jgi:DNA-binding transcriptional MerR regulator
MIETAIPARLKIGAVAKMAGVSVHTLRKWEERYNAVEPARTEGGGRVYSNEDVERLILIKQLAGAGLGLRQIAHLPLAELTALHDKVSQPSDAQAVPLGRPANALAVGPTVGALLNRVGTIASRLRVVASFPDERAVTVDDLPDADVLIIECPSLQHDNVRHVHELVERTGIGAGVVIYGFASRGTLLAMQSPEIVALRAPADAATIEQAVRRLVTPLPLSLDEQRRPAHSFGVDADVPPPRISREVISRMAASTPRAQCECPHHLADILLGLRAFEAYSADCESRTPQDAALHHYLWRTSAQARALFEDAIERIAEAEGIDLSERDA